MKKHHPLTGSAAGAVVDLLQGLLGHVCRYRPDFVDKIGWSEAEVRAALARPDQIHEMVSLALYCLDAVDDIRENGGAPRTSLSGSSDADADDVAPRLERYAPYPGMDQDVWDARAGRSEGRPPSIATTAEPGRDFTANAGLGRDPAQVLLGIVRELERSLVDAGFLSQDDLRRSYRDAEDRSRFS